MAIATAVQRGAYVYLYDENNRAIASLPAGNGPCDGLKGYTPSRVNIQRGAFVYSYDGQGKPAGTFPAR